MELLSDYVKSLEKKYGPIQVRCSGSDELPIDAMTEFQGDLKKISDTSLRKMIKSIYVHGFIAPFFIFNNAGDWQLLDGHQRCHALCKIRECGGTIPGLFPVVVIEATSEKQAREYLLAITSQYGEFQKDVLDDWLKDIDLDIAETFRMVDTEIDLNLDELLGDGDKETEGDDEFEEDNVPAISEEGDLWELGRHRLLCGDSTKEEDVKKLSGGVPVDLYLTDPHYNVAYVGKTKDALTIKNDSMEDTKFRAFLTDMFTAASSIMKPGAVFYIWHADSEEFNFQVAIKDNDWKFSQLLIWNKNYMVLGRKDYHSKHEPCLYGWKKGAGHLWSSDRKQTTILNFDKPQRSELHPTMKPVELFEYCLLNNTKELDIVYDSCTGSGTTLISAEKNNRIAYCMELDPHYVDVIVNRYARWCTDNDRPVEIKRNGDPYSINISDKE